MMASLGEVRPWRWVMLALVATGAILPSIPAVAQEDGREAKTPKDQARELFAIGLEQYERGDYHGAIASYEKAFALVKVPVITFNIGLAYEKAGQPVEAVAAMEKVLASPGTLRPERITQARSTLASQKALIAELDVSCNVTGARVRLGDDEVGTIPLSKPIPVAAGKVVVVQATKSGYQAGHARVEPPGGQKVPVVLELQEAKSAPAQVEVYTTLPDGELYVDGKLVAVTPLRSSIPVTPDVQHRIELRRRGYVPAEDVITLSEGARGSVTLQPQEDRNAVLAEGGELVLNLVQPDASVFIDGQRREITEATSLRLPPGAHLITGERKGYDPLNLLVEIPAGGEVDRTLDLIPTPATRAELIGDAQYWGALGWGLTLGGAAFVGTGVGLIAYGVNKKSAGEELQARIDAGEGPYAACGDPSSQTQEESTFCTKEELSAARASDHGKIIAGVAGVGASLGLATMVTGIVFLATAEDPDQYRLKLDDDVFGLSLEPAFEGGPRRGMVGIRGTF